MPAQHFFVVSVAVPQLPRRKSIGGDSADREDDHHLSARFARIRNALKRFIRDENASTTNHETGDDGRQERKASQSVTKAFARRGFGLTLQKVAETEAHRIAGIMKRI